MMRLYSFVIFCLLTFCFSTVNARHGLDPVSFSFFGNLPAQTVPNQSYSFVYQFTSNLPFTMPTPFYVSTTASSNEFSVVNRCNGLKLAPHASCTVSIVFNPISAGTKTFGIAMEYGKNKVPLRNLTTVVSASNSQIQGIVSQPFPTAILSNVTYNIAFTFTNTGTTTANNVTVILNANNTPGFTETGNTCGSSLNAQDSCTLSGSYATAATSGSVSEGATLTSSVGNASVNTATIVDNSTGSEVRKFTFINNCTQAVSLGFNGGAIANSPVCHSTSECPYGSLCNPTTTICYYANPTPTNGIYTLAANGGTNTASITDYQDLPAVWSGGIAGRTGCSPTGSCQTADCGSNGENKACLISHGFSNPATLAELTLERKISDTYDITAINGVNIGLSMGPTNNVPASTQAYFCGNPGGAVANNMQMGDCNWDLTSFLPTPASNGTTYVYVNDTTSHACTTNTDCTGFAGTVCGMSFNSTANTITKKCGIQLGFLNANQVCSFAHTNFNYPNNGLNPGDPYFNCDSQLTTPANLSPYSELSMYACKTPNAAASTLNSCYKSYGHTVDDCCGCVDWWTVSGVNVPQSATQSCGGNMNSFWTGTVQATISWLKKACPTMYTYQYDDASSKFTCNNIVGSSQNTVNYTITFCPS